MTPPKLRTLKTTQRIVSADESISTICSTLGELIARSIASEIMARRDPTISGPESIKHGSAEAGLQSSITGIELAEAADILGPSEKGLLLTLSCSLAVHRPTGVTLLHARPPKVKGILPDLAEETVPGLSSSAEAGTSTSGAEATGSEETGE